jgi:hypothetical protein
VFRRTTLFTFHVKNGEIIAFVLIFPGFEQRNKTVKMKKNSETKRNEKNETKKKRNEKKRNETKRIGKQMNLKLF